MKYIIRFLEIIYLKSKHKLYPEGSHKNSNIPERHIMIIAITWLYHGSYMTVKEKCASYDCYVAAT